MTSSNGNIFRVTGPLCGEFTGPGEFPTQRSVTRSFNVFFDLRLNKRLSKQPWGWWFETPSWSLWRQCNDSISLMCVFPGPYTDGKLPHEAFVYVDVWLLVRQGRATAWYGRFEIWWIYLEKWGKLVPSSYTKIFRKQRINIHRDSFVILIWRHNECDGFSNNQHHDCLLRRLFRCRSKKTA